ncbi:penicillin-binding protein 1C [Undibacterium curvum]|uniref:penicillin-binding protein 1C n=1 Tax=Undibacterium curvum TaxID=2762294 RepID=UPI003D10B003
MISALWRQAALACICSQLCSLLPYAVNPAYGSELSDFARFKAASVSSDATLYDRNGQVLQRLRVDMQERKLAWVRLEDISPAVRNALIASEDKRFYEHSGVDWSAVAASAWGNLWNTRTRGASTITMQLAGLLEQDLRRKAGSRSLAQKVNQAWVAQTLERNWKKDQILEAYLNLVPFRGELVGIHALSQVMFQKHPSGLDYIEAAIAVALLRGPNATEAKVTERACLILREQKQPGLCTNLEGQIRLAFAQLSRGLAVAGNFSNETAVANLAPHFARKVLSLQQREFRSSLSRPLQVYARDSLVRHLSALVERNVEDGAVLVLDNATGEILAWVGSSGQLSDASQVDGVQALRQAGSTLKPFLFEMAIENRLITAASVLDDTPVNLSTSNGLYIPQNYDKHFKGLVSARTALASSLNIPAVRLLVSLQPEAFFQRLRALGMDLRESGNYYGYSLALGSADISLLQLTNAYRALANQGSYTPVKWSVAEQGTTAKQVMQAGASYIVSDILSDRAARSVTFGLENALSTRIWTAVKTGTSKDMRDNWCIGYSDRYTVGVWVGNASGAPMWDVSGVTGAAPVWQDVMHYLHRSRPQRAVVPPNGLVRQTIRYDNALEAERSEWFLAGTAQSQIQLGTSNQIQPHILYPKAGMIAALDPDIPLERQRIRIAAYSERGMLVLDGKKLTASLNPKKELSYDWFPFPGRHMLSLLDAEGHLQDQIMFEVRGAQMKAPR